MGSDIHSGLIVENSSGTLVESEKKRSHDARNEKLFLKKSNAKERVEFQKGESRV